MKFTLEHTNINVLDTARSVKFYEEALGMHETRTIKADDGSHVLTFMSDDVNQYMIELTWLKERTEPYDLGDNETHIAFRVDDIDAAHKLHAEMDCICFENKNMGLYFIEDPDGYWLEIIPARG